MTPKKQKKDSFHYVMYGVMIVVGIFLILIFASRIVDDEGSEHYTYNAFEFVKVGNMYQTQIQLLGKEQNLYNLEFRHGPKELEDIPIIGEPKYFLNADAMYVTFDPTDKNLSSIGVATSDIQMNLARVLEKSLVAACTQNSTGCENASIKTCDNTDAPVIFVRHDPVALVEQKDNCLIVQGKGMEVVESADRLLYYLYGIMDK
jgi:hypothetical protein